MAGHELKYSTLTAMLSVGNTEHVHPYVYKEDSQFPN